MPKSKYLLVFLIAIATALIVYYPHYNYPMPLHIDEWHHISEGIRIGNYGEYLEYLKMENSFRFNGMEVGFQFFLFLLSGIFNLVVVYQFLPALWAALSALVIFYVVYKKTDGDYYTGIWSMIFFASIKSNVNLTGLWFFTPLTFAIPFIFLYIYFLTEGFRLKKTNYILISLAIMVFLIPVHSISLLFALPALLIYALINFKFVAKKLPVFLLFLIIPLVGVFFYKYTLHLSWMELPKHIIQQLQFKHGWGVLEVLNAPTEVYSVIGYILAVIGAIYILIKKTTNRFAFYLIWPLTVIAAIALYRISGISFLAPYQRNLYYLALSLPVLSAIGSMFILQSLNKRLSKLLSSRSRMEPIHKVATITVNLKLKEWQRELIRIVIVSIVGLLMVIFTFNSYLKMPKGFEVYQAIDKNDYKTLLYLANLPNEGKVMATPFMSAAIYPVSKHHPIANLAFYGNVSDIEKFFLKTDCEQKKDTIRVYDIRYIISPAPLDCDYKIDYSQNGNIIYVTEGKNIQ